ncbi:MAG: FecR domain-containing protein [Dehalococcoidia bacterium]|nr:FecR domain-containing protein [Dehalococcoidia bacterium]
MSKWLALNLILLFALIAGSISCGGQPVPATSFQSPSEPTTVSTVSGEVMVMKVGTNTWSQVSHGMVLRSGDRIKTGPASKAVITFFEGSTIELATNTDVGVAELGIAELTGSTAIKLQQQIGKTTNRVKKLADPASRYEIETPDGAAVVRGSVGDVIVTEGNSTTIINRQGQWSAIFNGREYSITQGYQITFVRGQKTEPKQEPVSPPTIVPPPPLPPEANYPSQHGSTPPVILIPVIALAKTADRTQACVNNIITYTYRVTNPGNTPLSNISITDDKAGTPTYQSGDLNGDNKLDVNETWVFMASYTVLSQSQTPFTLVNTATVSGSYGLYSPITAQDSASVEILIPCPRPRP